VLGNCEADGILGHDGRGGVTIRIEAPLASAHPDLEEIDPADFQKT